MLLFTLLFFGSSLVYLAFGIYVMLINRHSSVNRMFFFLCLSLGLWALGLAMINCTESKVVAYQWLLVSAVGWCLFPGVFLNFSLLLTKNPIKRVFRLLFLLPAILFFFFYYAALPLENLVQTQYGWVYIYAAAGIRETLYNLYVISYLLAICLILLHWKLTAASLREKRQAEIVFATTTIAIVLAVGTDIILMRYWNRIVPVGIIICLIAIIGAGYSILKYKMLKSPLEIESKYILKTMSDPVIYLNQDFVMIEFNKALLNVTGYSDEELINKPVDFLFCNGINIPNRFHDGEPQSIENSIFSMDGREINCLISATAVVDTAGDYFGFVCLLHDITEKKKMIDELESRVTERTKELILINQRLSDEIQERKRINQALLDAEQKEKQLLKETLELKDNFITLITHEFKTPIAIINAALQTMEAVCSDELSGKSLKYLSKIKQNSFRQQRLVENLLDVASLRAGMIKINYENTDIVMLTREIADSVKVFAQRKNIEVHFESVLEREFLMLDTEKYERILLNLLSNAIKFTPSEQTVRVILSREESFVKLEVVDRGIGIPADKQDLVFEKFEQINNTLSRHAEGTGIGLYLVKSFAEALGGTVKLLSKEGSGTTFTVLLPILQEQSGQNNIIHKDVIDQVVSLELSDIVV